MSGLCQSDDITCWDWARWVGVGGQFSLVETCGAFWGSRFLMFLEVAIEIGWSNIGWDLVSGDVAGCVWFCGRRWCGQRTPWGVKMCNRDRLLGYVCVCVCPRARLLWSILDPQILPNFQDCNMMRTTFTDCSPVLDGSFAEMQRFKQEIVRLYIIIYIYLYMLDYARLC